MDQIISQLLEYCGYGKIAIPLLHIPPTHHSSLVGTKRNHSAGISRSNQARDGGSTENMTMGPTAPFRLEVFGPSGVIRGYLWPSFPREDLVRLQLRGTDVPLARKN